MTRERAGLTLAAVAFAAILFAPLSGLTPEAHRLAAVIAAVVVLWVTEAIPLPVTALIGVAGAVALGVAPAREAFAPFADPLMFLFIGAFMIARAIFVHGLNRRVAYAVLSLPWVGRSPGRILFAFGAVTAAISGWISNTATTAMMFGIGMSILAAMGEDVRRSAYATALMLMTSFSASVGGLATPIGTPPNVIGLGFIRTTVGEEVSFFRWMMLGVPVVLTLYAVLYVWLNFVSRTTAGDLAATRELIRRERASLGPWTRGQRSVAAAFGFTVFLWVLPGIVALAAGEQSAAFRTLNERLPEGVAAIAGALLLFLLPGAEGRRAITWDEAVKIDWGVVLLYGGGFALGVLSFRTGLAEAAGRGLTGLLPISGELGLLIASVAVAVLLSEATSNTAAANMVVPVVISIAKAAGMDPFEPALGATMAASLGFMLPVSTPCNAIVYGSGLIPLGKMIRYGAVLDVAGAVVIIVLVRLLGSVVR
ncbi:MAG TPA: DASS family sodium-coupled anion symporter [Gemmatimonadales bacterium]|nr:DASS family sodium-coupled anion symporter [Gemmatimonadales bacterium]